MQVQCTRQRLHSPCRTRRPRLPTHRAPAAHRPAVIVPMSPRRPASPMSTSAAHMHASAARLAFVFSSRTHPRTRRCEFGQVLPVSSHICCHPEHAAIHTTASDADYASASTFSGQRPAPSTQQLRAMRSDAGAVVLEHGPCMGRGPCGALSKSPRVPWRLFPVPI